MRTVLVTGSSSGIGLSIAKSFASDAFVIMHGLKNDDCSLEAVSSVRALGSDDVHYIAEDISTIEGCQRLVKAAEQSSGRTIDVLVNNAGIQHTAAIENFPPDQWQNILNTNLSAAFWLSQAVIGGMKTRGFGRIINIASVHGLVASVHKAAYVAAKHGLVGLSKVIALETAQQNITSNTICPGWVRTPMVEKQIQERVNAEGVSSQVAQSELLSEKQPSGQFVDPSSIAALVKFLCTDDAAQITGSALTIDGGWTAV